MEPRPHSRSIHGGAARGSTALRALSAAAGLALALASAACNRPPEVDEHMKRGDAALAAGRFTYALAAYNHARELAPQDAQVQRALMRARAYVIAEQPARINPDGAEDARYEVQLLLDSEKGRDATYQTALGNILARSGDVDGAKLKFAEALKADPTSPQAHTALALVLMGRKDGAAQAKAELELALKVKPEHQIALIALAQIKLGEGDLPGAIDKLETALRVGDDAQARMLLGSARLQQQKPADAVEHFQRAAQLDPRNPDALGSLGQALLASGRAEEAERALRTAAQMRPDSATFTALGFALSRQKKPDQAMGAFGQVLAQDGTSAPALYGAGMASEELGKKEQALDYYKRLLSLPADGRDRQVTAGLQQDAQARVGALTAPAPTSSALAPPAPGAANKKAVEGAAPLDKRR